MVWKGFLVLLERKQGKGAILGMRDTQILFLSPFWNVPFAHPQSKYAFERQ